MGVLGGLHEGGRPWPWGFLMGEGGQAVGGLVAGGWGVCLCLAAWSVCVHPCGR